MGYLHIVHLLFLFIFSSVLADGLPNENKVHIVYLGSKPSNRVEVASMHQSMLETVFGSADAAKGSLIHSYGRSFNGFVARLSDEEVERISDMEGVVSVFPSEDLKLHTTRSWDFMDFNPSSIGNGDANKGDVIVGMIDTGVWPESESFNDGGFGPPPTNWKGTCQSENNFTCNNKIIGARYYKLDGYYPPGNFKSPRDAEGHGSHTASTAAGREVSGASYYGLAKGLARGGAPNARIAVYKVCWLGIFVGCSSADILAAFDDAIADGVHIISVSLGGGGDIQYFQDTIAIGSFHAMVNGILTCNSGGNSGPWRATVANHSPWSFTIAASTIDRKFVSSVVLGNGQIFTGIAINAFELNGTSFPLIWGGDAPDYSAYSSPLVSSFCYPGDMDSTKVKGKLVICESLSDGSGVLEAGGIGAIMPENDFYKDLAYAFPLAVTLLSQEDIAKVMDYIRYTEYPVATILGEASSDVMAPVVASFSSRGPHPINADILKPDITAPGVDILAAWSPVAPASASPGDMRRVQYNIISGTSMSCPHVSGAAAYLKSIHPSWSPAAIKSALMTTASPMDPNKNDDQEFAYGSGHLNPTKAADPGLVFDASELDYISFLCKQGYNATAIGLITGINSSCDGIKPGRAWDLNYPSFALAIEDGQKIDGIFNRTVTNVGSPNSTYHVSVSIPNTVKVTVKPSVLSFSGIGERQSFTVKVNGPEIWQESVISGSITWTDDTHVVRTPLAVYNALASVINSHTSGRELSMPESKRTPNLINLPRKRVMGMN